MPADEKLISGSTTKSPGSSTALSKSSSEEDTAAAKRAAFHRQLSGTNSPSRPKLEHQLSRDGSLRRRSSAYRRQSSFDLAHVNSILSVPDLKNLESIDKSLVPWWTSQRLLLSVLTFLGFLFLYAQRVNLSIAIVSMVDHSHYHDRNGTSDHLSNASTYSNTTNSSFSFGPLTNETANGETSLCPQELKKSQTPGEFKWSKDLTGLVLGAFFWGYLILQVPGGRMSEKIGAKKVIAISMFPVCILTMLSPVSARASPYLFIVVRILVGLGEGAVYPAAQSLWSRWAPPNERARLIGFSYAGGQFGNALIFPIGGFLCAYGFDGGWPSVFYVIGAGGFLWCIAWVLFAYDAPEQNPRCKDIERKYIKYSIGDRLKIKKGSSTPWKAIFTSRPMWAIIVAHSCGNYGAYMLLTQIPTYMKEVLKFDIKSNGVFSMLPYLMFWFFIAVSGMVADFLISREILTTAWTRKLMTCIGTIGPGSFLIGTGFMECTQQIEAVVMLTIAVGLCGFHFSGYFINHGDIAPAYAGTLFGISNTASTIPGILAPYVVSALTPNGTRLEWQIAFYVAAAIYYFGAIFFVIFGDGEVQEWAEFYEDDTMTPAEEAEMGVGFGLHEITEKVVEEEEDEDDKPTQKMLESNGDIAKDVKV